VSQFAKYVGINPIQKLHDGEPYFFIRAQDVFSPAAIQAYATISGDHRDLHPVIDEFVRWQKENPDKVKTPD